jgi:DNA invertase Pin-like site-specific DNA recombinase
MADQKLCAIYTRKSSAEGLEQDFNSLDAQREASEAYIKSQQHEGWICSRARYDDGAYSGGTMERPALQRLLEDIRGGRVQLVVVYKVDRLTRSLADFAQLVELFDSHGVSFVSVTQQFNTTSSMGRLTLNVLLSFAQFEREITGERIRDKLAASKQKGMWMGGFVPLGYDVVDRELVINKEEAETVRLIFTRYLALGSVRSLKEELDKRGITSKKRISQQGVKRGGKPLSRGGLYKLLNNPLYLGKIRHKEAIYEGNHTGIIDEATWQATQGLLDSNRLAAKDGVRASHPSLLAGILYDDRKNPMSPSHAVKNGKRYRYYVSQAMIQGSKEKAGSLARLPAGELEKVVIYKIQRFLKNPLKLTEKVEARSAESEAVITRAKELAGRLRKNPGLARRLLTRVVISSNRLKLTLSGNELRTALGLEAVILSRSSFDLAKKISLQRCQGESRLILTHPDGTQEAQVNPALVKAISRAWVWNQQLKNKEVQSIREIAERDGFDGRYICQILPLAKLSPPLINRILEGLQPPDMTIGTLRRITSLDWREQLSDF